MIEAVLTGAMGTWIPNSIRAGTGERVDRTPDVDGAVVESGAAVAFEQALAAELRRAGDLDPFDAGFEMQNGAVLSRAAESQQAAGRIDHSDAGGVRMADADDKSAAAGPFRRVGFDDDSASSRISSEQGDRFGDILDVDHGAAFRRSDCIATHAAFLGGRSFSVDETPEETLPGGRLFFNGDGRPIIPRASIEIHDEPVVADFSCDEGDLMILPNGAVLAYDPWTVTVSGDIAH